MPVCRLRFQMELNLVRKKKNSKSHHWCCGSVSPGLPSNPAVLVLLCRFQLQWAGAFAGRCLMHSTQSWELTWWSCFCPAKAQIVPFWVCWMWVPKVGNGSWCEGVPESRRTRCTSVLSPGEVNLEFFWVLFCKRNIVLVLTWSYHNCNKILKDFIIADWFCGF